MPNAFAENLDGFPDADVLVEHLVESARRGCPSQYVEYGINKAVAMRARVAADIPKALKHERNCDDLYEKIPSMWRAW